MYSLNISHACTRAMCEWKADKANSFHHLLFLKKNHHILEFCFTSYKQCNYLFLLRTHNTTSICKLMTLREGYESLTSNLWLTKRCTNYPKAWLPTSGWQSGAQTILLEWQKLNASRSHQYRRIGALLPASLHIQVLRELDKIHICFLLLGDKAITGGKCKVN
jgi:hypothetical protein